MQYDLFYFINFYKPRIGVLIIQNYKQQIAILVFEILYNNNNMSSSQPRKSFFINIYYRIFMNLYGKNQNLYRFIFKAHQAVK